MSDMVTLEGLHKGLQDLSGHVLTLAKDYYKADVDGPMGIDDEEDISDIMPTEDKMPPMDYKADDMMPYEEEEEDHYMARMRKAFRVAKGFADSADDASSEEDAKFGDKDSDIGGNEPSPQGEQGGDKEDETFGPGGMAYSAMLKAANKQIGQLGKVVAEMQANKPQVIAKGVVPGQGVDPRRGGQPVKMTRELEEQVKGLTFKEINRMRTAVGDLNQHVF
jgi:hypothetical protein